MKGKKNIKNQQRNPSSSLTDGFEVMREDDGTIKIKVVIPAETAKKERVEIEEELIKEVVIPGFRKGAAPKNLARQKISKEKLKERLLESLLPRFYTEAVQRAKIMPIINPRIHIEPFDEGTDIEFTIQTCEEPVVDLKNYKEEIKKLKAAASIIVPGKEKPKAPSLSEILDTIIKTAEVKIPHILVEEETERALANLLSEIKSLGLTLETYLSSQNKTAGDLRKEYEEKAKKDLALEFILRKIADSEKITVEQKDIDELLAKVESEEKKKELQENIYYLSSLIRQQKILDFLSKI